MKLFVTGGAGFIGSNFIRHILAHRKDWSVVNYDKLTYAGNLANLDPVAGDARYSMVRGCVCDPAAVEAKLLGGDELGDQPAIEGGKVSLTFDMGEKA